MLRTRQFPGEFVVTGPVQQPGQVAQDPRMLNHREGLVLVPFRIPGRL